MKQTDDNAGEPITGDEATAKTHSPDAPTESTLAQGSDAPRDPGTEPTLAQGSDAPRDPGTEPTLAQGDDSPASGLEATVDAGPGNRHQAHTASAKSDVLGPGTLIDRYVVLGELGRGGMGVVLEAHDPELKRAVALKLLKAGPTMSHDARERLVREGQAIAQLAHPNVVQVFDVGRHGDEVFFAMEFIKGLSLRDWLETKRTRNEVIDVFVQAARGLDAAHAKGIIHRDFKPDNVVVGESGRVRVLDFGLARGQTSNIAQAGLDAQPIDSLTMDGAIMGTPWYMAPELFEGRQVDAAVDQFAFCVALYDALCGKHPFGGETFGSLRDNVTNGRLRPCPAEAKVPRWLEELLIKGLSVDPTERHSSLGDLIDELELDRKRRLWPVLATILAVALATAFFVSRSTSDGTGSLLANKPNEFVTDRLVRREGMHLHPSFFPDGEHFLFSDRVDLYVGSVGADSLRNLTESFEPPATEPELSPDGRSVAFSAAGKIYVAAVDGDLPPRLVADGYWPTWSPDGRDLAFTTGDVSDVFSVPGGGGSQLWKVNLVSGQRQMLAPGFAAQPTWSPDGKHIAFTDLNVVYLVGANGGDVRDSGLRGVWHPVWQSSGEGIYAVRERNGTYEIVEFGCALREGKCEEVGQVVKLSTTPAWHFAVSRDAKRWIVSSRSARLATHAVPFDPIAERTTGLPERVTEWDNALISPAVSPDGKRIAFAAYTEVNEALYVRGVDEDRAKKVYEAEEYLRAPVWTADGKEIVFQGQGPGPWGIYAIQPDGTQRRTLAVADDLKFPHGSPTGTRLAVTASPDETHHYPYVIRVAEDWLAQGTEQHNPQLAGWRTGPWSPDGRWVAVLSDKGVGRLNTADFTFEEVTSFGSDADWLSDSRRLVLAQDRQLVLFDVVTRQTKHLLSLAKLTRVTDLPSLDVAPDDRTIYVSTIREQAVLHLLREVPQK